MKRPARLLIASYLATLIAGVGSGSGKAAEASAVEQGHQDLSSVKASKLVISAVWMRQPDSYTLQIVLDRSSSAMQARPPADALRKLVPQNTGGPMPTPIPNWQEPNAGGTTADRSSYFIGNTIANLRGVDPWIACGRTLTLIDGRRVVQTSQATPAPTPTPPPVKPPSAPNTKEIRVEVWLLKSDGTQIQPATYTCVDSSRYPSTGNDVSISYGYSNADVAQAVAAAIRIDGDFYIEKLQPLVAAPPVQ